MKRKHFFSGVIILSGLGALCVWFFLPDRGTSVVVLDVGQGDAIYIDAPQHIDVLIDGGPDAAVVEKLSAHMPFFDRTIELVIITHPHADHLAGLMAVAERYTIEKVIEADTGYDSSLVERWKTLKREKGIVTISPQAGQRLELGSEVALNILYPAAEDLAQQTDDANEFSVVAQLEVGQRSMLLTGDLPGITESKLLQRNLKLSADILKIAHHGSATSSREDFVKAVQPRAALLSVGQTNRYRHPSPRVIELFSKLHTPLFRTDEDGDIVIRFSADGTLTVSAKNGKIIHITTQNQQ